jgi:hypothetical protein
MCFYYLVGEVSPSLRSRPVFPEWMRRVNIEGNTGRVLRYPLMGNRVVHFDFHKKPGSPGTPKAFLNEELRL